MIVAEGPDFIRLQIGRRTATLAGEASPDGPGGADFVVFLDRMEHWDAPDDGEALTLDDISRIARALEIAFAAKGRLIEFE